MPKLVATKNRPTVKPTPKPSAALASVPRCTAKINAARKLQTNAVAKMRAGCRGAVSGSTPASAHQAFLNNGPYQIPPSRKADSAAAMTASQLRSIGGMPMKAPVWVVAMDLMVGDADGAVEPSVQRAGPFGRSKRLQG